MATWGSPNKKFQKTVILEQPIVADGSLKVSGKIDGVPLEIPMSLNARNGKRKKEITCSLSNQAAAL